MTWGQPLALLGLAALPLIWWLHRKLRRPPEVVMPSLMFLQDEDDASKLPRGRRLDAELLLALAGAALLALAAAEPALVRSAPRRAVRVVVDTRVTRPDARGYGERVLATREALAAALDADDELTVVPVPAAGDAVFTRRPDPSALLAAARAGEASARFVVTDDPPPAETGGVHWIALGDPDVANQALVAMHVRVTEAGASVFCTVANFGRAPVDVLLEAGWVEPERVARTRGPRLTLPADGMASQTLELGRRVERVTVRLLEPDGRDHADALPEDDAVVLTRRVFAVHVAPGLPGGVGRHVATALEASLGTGGYRLVAREEAGGADLHVVPRGAALAGPGWGLEVEPIAEGGAAQHAPDGVDALGAHPLVADLTTAGVDWVYAAGADAVAAGERVLLAREVGDRTWPVVLARTSARRLRLAPDPLRGEPSAVATPFWPLLLDNLVAVAAGPGAGAGYRAQGLLDAATSRPGRARIPFDPAAIAGAAPSVPGRTRPLRPLLIMGALACLALLWASPRVRRRLTPKPALAPSAGS